MIMPAELWSSAPDHLVLTRSATPTVHRKLDWRYDGFAQGAGRLLVASHHADVAGDHDAGGQRQPEPEHPCSL